MRRVASWVLGLALLLTACGPGRVRVSDAARNYEPDDYRGVLKTWTRDNQLITLEAMDNVLTVTSTYHSWDFRQAYVARYANDFRLTPQDRQAMLARQKSESAETEFFYVSLYAQNAKYGDLKLEDPAWVVRLVDDSGAEVPPLDIQPVKRPGAVENTYFPYTSVWRTSYRITFPRMNSAGRPVVRADAAWFGLRFAGPQGQTTLVWEIEH